jgi:hypothetical protein
MTTSGTFVFSVSRDDIIREALLNIRKLDELEIPTPQETIDCARKLNMMCKQWQGTADFAPGLKTWTRRHGHLFLSNTTGQYTIGPGATGWTNSYRNYTLAATAAGGQPVVVVTDSTSLASASTQKIGVVLDSGALFWGQILSVIGNTVTLTTNLPSQASANAVVFVYVIAGAAQQPIVIETAFLRDINNNDTPLNIIRNIGDYDILPSKVDTSFISDPTAIYYEFQLTSSTLFTDVAASEDVTKHICMSYLESIQDFNNPLDTPEYPQEWFLALSWGLAKQICPMYGANWTALMQDNFTAALLIAQRKDPEIVTMFFQAGE